jgi:CelD/BcsL family acetyltransferase involved in cellulose biosynthesis
MSDLTFPLPRAASRPAPGAPALAGPRRYRLGDLEPRLGRLAGAELSIYDDIAACAERWREAMESCVYWGFQSIDWLDTWQQTIGETEAVAPCIAFVADAGGKPLAVLPLGLYRRHGLRVLRFLGNVVTDYNAPLIDAALAAEMTPQDTALLWSAIVRLLPRADLVWLHRMPETIENTPNPFAALPGARPGEHAHSTVVPASIEAFRKSRSHSLFKYTRRRRRQLVEELGAAAEFTAAATPEEAQRILDDLKPLKSQRWHETRCRDLFAEPAFCAFYDRMTAKAIDGGKVQAYAISVGGTPVAALWGFSFGRRLYCLLLCRADGKWARYSPGSLLIENIIEWCVAAPDVDIFDLSSGEEAFKQRWTDCQMQLFDYQAGHSLAGRAYLAVYRAKEWLKRNAALRNFIRQLKGKKPKVVA